MKMRQGSDVEFLVCPMKCRVLRVFLPDADIRTAARDRALQAGLDGVCTLAGHADHPAGRD